MYPKEPEALAVATQAHRGQKRKGKDEDYICHPMRVAERVRGLGGDEAMVCAALLHDVVEDTDIPLDHIDRVFGTDVGNLVLELTEPKHTGLNRHTRVTREIMRLLTISPRAKVIKLADIEDNLSAIEDLDLKFGRQYLREKLRALGVLRNANRDFYQRVIKLAYQKAEKLGMGLV